MLAFGLALQLMSTACGGAVAPAVAPAIAPACAPALAPAAARAAAPVAMPWATPYVPPTPLVDGPEDGPVWLEFALPALAPRAHSARTETLIVVPRGTALEVSSLQGDIVVEGWPRNVVRIVARHDRGDRVATRIENGVLVIETSRRRGGPASVDYQIRVPRWMALRLSGLDTGISVEGVTSPISAESVRGDVEVRGGEGLMQLSSIEGRVYVNESRGPVEATSVNSLIQLMRVAGQVRAESVNGNIDLRQVESPDVDASSVNGSVVFASAFRPRGRYRLASHNGNIHIGVPEDAGVDVSVATHFGAFESGFPLQLGPLHRGRRFGFTLGRGGSSLELESFQGVIQLLRPGALPAAAPPPAPMTPRAPESPQAPQPPDPEER